MSYGHSQHDSLFLFLKIYFILITYMCPCVRWAYVYASVGMCETDFSNISTGRQTQVLCKNNIGSLSLSHFPSPNRYSGSPSCHLMLDCPFLDKTSLNLLTVCPRTLAGVHTWHFLHKAWDLPSHTRALPASSGQMPHAHHDMSTFYVLNRVDPCLSELGPATLWMGHALS